MQLDRRTIARVGFWLALVYGVALAGPCLYAALFAGDGWSLAGALFAASWTAAPVYAAAAFAGASPGRTGALLFLLLELALIASFGWQLTASPGGLVFIGWPLFQWAAIVLAFLLALALGWRKRPDFLKD